MRDCAVRGTTLQWVQGLVAQAKAVWTHRRRLAVRSYEACRADKAIRQWLSTLPFDAYVYDLRHQAPARGFPYGLAGWQGRLYRCGRLPVFAVCGWPTGSRWAEDPAEVLPKWLKAAAFFLPLTHALNGMRKALIRGDTLTALPPEIGPLTLFSAVLFLVGITSFMMAINRTKVTGTLGQY